jgi:hypothetical protein
VAVRAHDERLGVAVPREADEGVRHRHVVGNGEPLSLEPSVSCERRALPGEPLRATVQPAVDLCGGADVDRYRRQARGARRQLQHLEGRARFPDDHHDRRARGQ